METQKKGFKSNFNFVIFNIFFSFFLFVEGSKKSEFGPASISVDKLNTDNIKILYMLENKSKLIIDGNLMEPNAKSVYETLYGQ